ncbi:hypothetical protein F0562_034364 [Nyssa sinensis]|uniref:Uncharacterized protein n=1 Tax=Nyssa sinensis TaxID=561372 RepID=A0A5J5AJ03_9ASTE|nr:hypothetical protein F0562_034364 [Nyssa sinensis]
MKLFGFKDLIHGPCCHLVKPLRLNRLIWEIWEINDDKCGFERACPRLSGKDKGVEERELPRLLEEEATTVRTPSRKTGGDDEGGETVALALVASLHRGKEEDEVMSGFSVEVVDAEGKVKT